MVVTTAMTTGEIVWAKKISSSSTSVVISAIRSPLPRPSSLAGARRRMAANAFDRNSASSLNATLWFMYCSAYRISPRTTAQTAIAAMPAVMLTPQTGSSNVANSANTPNTGRSAAARWPSVPHTQAAIITGRSGPTSRSSLRIRPPVPDAVPGAALAASPAPEPLLPTLEPLRPTRPARRWPCARRECQRRPLDGSEAPESNVSESEIPVSASSEEPGEVEPDASESKRVVGGTGGTGGVGGAGTVRAVRAPTTRERCPTCSMVCCARNSRAYTPLSAISPTWVPVSATRPWSKTTT